MLKILKRLKIIAYIIIIIVALIVILGIVFAVVFLLNKVGIISDADLTSFTPTTTSSISANGNFLEAARQCHEYVRVNKFTYSNTSNKSIPITSSDSYIDCSSYVTWALYEYGYTDLKGGQLACSGGSLVNWCNANLEMVWSGFTHDVTDIADIQAGDICIMGYESQQGGSATSHTQIFAGYTSSGIGIWYNCGSNNSILKVEGEDQYNIYNSKLKDDPDETKYYRGFLYVYRVPSLT